MKNYVIKECRFDLQDIYADRLDCEYKKNNRRHCIRIFK